MVTGRKKTLWLSQKTKSQNFAIIRFFGAFLFLKRINGSGWVDVSNEKSLAFLFNLDSFLSPFHI